LNVMDSFPIELLFPIRAGRSAQQIGTKNRDKGRWSIGLKICWVLNHLGQVVGWHWLPMNHSDQDFLPLVALLS
ncbi:MAG: transposase, partial [Chloroflexota bacterium]